MFNKAVGSISETRMGVLSEWSLRLALAFLFFSHGLPKIEALIAAPGEPFSLAQLQQVLVRHAAVVRSQEHGLPLLELMGLGPFEFPPLATGVANASSL